MTHSESLKTFLFKMILGVLLGVFILFDALAQTQTVKGRVVDAQSAFELIGATVQVIDSEPLIGTVTDVNGYFRMENVPVGRQTLLVQYIGYKSVTIPNVLITAGKEVILNIQLEESVETLQEVVVTPDADKDQPINELAKVSARTFNLEQTLRFSGGRNDVSRLATSFAGVSAPNDSRNDIVVRGNSPTGLLWRVEGIPMATTNHFNTLGVTGGPVNALNTNMLRTSDFLTGAFPSEYGNANAAVFDINFRKGNTDKFEFTGQMAVTGLEFMAEGPIRRENNSSFLASYRYGIASVAATGTSAIPYYQDAAFKVSLGTKKLGRFDVFGMVGLSSIDFFGEEIDKDDLFSNPDVDAFVDGGLGLVGLTNTTRLGKNAFIETSVAGATYYNQYVQDNLMRDVSSNVVGKYRATEVENTENRYTLTSTLNLKLNSRWTIRTGFLNEIYQSKFFTRDRYNRTNIPDDNVDGVPDFFVTFVDVDETYNLLQLYGQAEYKLTDDLSTTFGVHNQHSSLNESTTLEPRAAISYQFRPNQRLSLAYGLHAQSIPAPVLFFAVETSPGVYERINDDLDFYRSHHYVVGYDRTFGPNWRLKAEAYYQALLDVPVELAPSSYSVLNDGANFVFTEPEGELVNEGTGSNLGVELTVEKFFSNNYYVLLTGSIFNSRYKGSDGIDRSTAFNNRYVGNVLFGKEWKFGKGQKNAWTFDTRLTTSGGKPFTPVDLDATRANTGREIRFDDQAFSQRYGEYFRWDVKFGVRINGARKNISHQFYIDLQNITNRSNEFVRRYNEVTDEINTVDQIGFFPDVLYKIQF